MQRFIFALLLSLPLAPLGFAASSTPAAEPTRHCFNGYAYNEDGSTLLYTEHHEQHLERGQPIQWEVSYRAVNADVMGAKPGEIIARKQFDFSNNPTVPVYTLELLGKGYKEGIRHDEKGWRMFKRASKNAETETESFNYKPPMAADSGFDPFVKNNFKALLAGDTVKFDFAAAGSLTTVGLRAFKVADTQFNGEPAVKFKAELSSLFRFVIDVAIEMTYHPESKKLLQYQGVSNMHNAEGNTFPVIIKYLDKVPAAAKTSQTPQGCSER